jgi:hypothetical protein
MINPETAFNQRILDRFGLPPRSDAQPILIKLAVSDCFHREHSPHAWQIIDEYLGKHPPDGFRLEKHESGPELLVWVAKGIGLVKSLFELITTILKARSDGLRKGDKSGSPVEIIVRKIEPDGRVTEERITRFYSREPMDPAATEQAINNAITKLLTQGNDERDL